VNQKWFWGAFLFLLTMSGAVISWALISSSLHFSPQVISHFENDLNGQKQKTDIWVNQGRLTDLTPLVLKTMDEQKWRPLSQGANFTNALLGIPDQNFDFSDQLQIKVFEKDGIYRTLSMLQSKDTDVTYGATSDIPKIAFNAGNAKNNWNFSIPVPNGAQLIYGVKLQNMKLGLILYPHVRVPFNEFIQTCATAGYSVNLEQEEKNKKVFLIANKKNRILAIFNQEDSHNCISLVQLQ
jgi:hypothetical protein